MKNTSVICDDCGLEFAKPTNEFNRSVRLERKQYCSRTCGAKNNHSHLDSFKGEYNQNLKRCKADDLSPFREFLRRSKRRNKEVEITAEYLKQIWDKQKGICPYSKISLVLPKGKGNCKIKTASLDRIDSIFGYIEGNLQFVSMSINFLKSDMSHDKVLELIELIKQS